MLVDLLKQSMIKDFDGDPEMFELAYQEYLETHSGDPIDWSDFVLSATVFPELEQQAKDLIEERLGYLPHQTVTIQFEPYLRALLKRYYSGDFDIDTFYKMADSQIRLIRNLDMIPNACLEYNPQIYKNYNATFVPYGYKVKERLTGFLGYEPRLEHSLIAEMWMREVMARDMLIFPLYITAIDYKAVTLIKYREVLLSQGQVTADQMPIACGT